MWICKKCREPYDPPEPVNGLCNNCRSVSAKDIKYKITPTTCIHGERHSWQKVIVRAYGFPSDYDKYSWCPGCGSITKFTKTRSKGRWRRHTNEDGSYKIVIPACHGE